MQWGVTEQWVFSPIVTALCVIAVAKSWGRHQTVMGDLTRGFWSKVPGQVAGQERVVDSYLFFMFMPYLSSDTAPKINEVSNAVFPEVPELVCQDFSFVSTLASVPQSTKSMWNWQISNVE